jgi:hypothetical protein
MPVSSARFLTWSPAALPSAPGRVEAGAGLGALPGLVRSRVSPAMRGRVMPSSKSNRMPHALTERRGASPLRHRLPEAWPGRA